MVVKSLGFRTDLMIRRLAGSRVLDRGDHLVVHTPANPRFYWGNFLLLAAPIAQGDAARWETAFAREFPDAQHRAFGVDGTDGEAGDPDDLHALRVTYEKSVVLTCGHPAEPARPDASFRPLSDDHDWAAALRLRIAVDASDSIRDTTFLERHTQEQRVLADSGHAAWWGAFVGGQLVSDLGLVTDGSGVARYQSVLTDPQHRRRGYARRLVYEAGLDAVAGGVRTLVIVADAGEHAIEIYRSVGFVDTELQVQLQRHATPAP